MAPYHVARSKLFIRERTAKTLVPLDTPEIEANIEHTRFPVPEDEQHESTDDFPGLVRAADLIGQLADINYLRKQAALFSEFRETGMSNKLKYNSVADLRANYPDFFWKTVRPYIGDALRYLRVTQEGQQWIANLYANVFAMEHRSYAEGSLNRAGETAAEFAPHEKNHRCADEPNATIYPCWLLLHCAHPAPTLWRGGVACAHATPQSHAEEFNDLIGHDTLRRQLRNGDVEKAADECGKKNAALEPTPRLSYA